MAGELGIQPIGEEIVDSLRDLQFYINQEDDPLLKRAIFHNGLRCQQLEYFCGSPALVTCSEAYAKSADLDEDSERLIIRRPLDFVGQVRQVGYMQDGELLLDSIAIVLDRPKIFARFEDQVDGLVETSELHRVQALRVPVLAIDAWVSGDELLKQLN